MAVVVQVAVVDRQGARQLRPAATNVYAPNWASFVGLPLADRVSSHKYFQRRRLPVKLFPDH
jgi:hypothetical protein